MKIKEVIVVEGRNDTIKVQQAVDAYTIETKGLAIPESIINQIKHAQKKRGVIIFTDPDYPGKRIRQIINDQVPGCKHAFLTQEEARDKKSQLNNLGIENASIETIRKALSEIYSIGEKEQSWLTKNTLLTYGLVGHPRAKSRRVKLGEDLRIGYANAKQFEKRLQLFQITEAQFKEAFEKIIQREQEEDEV